MKIKKTIIIGRKKKEDVPNVESPQIKKTISEINEKPEQKQNTSYDQYEKINELEKRIQKLEKISQLLIKYILRS